MSIKSELTKGVFWIAIARYSGIFISLGITAILARNVSPAAFGTMTVATVIMAFLDIFTDLGIGSAIIQFRNLTKHQINSLFMIGCAIGLIIASALFWGAIPLARFYNDNGLINVCRWLSLCSLFNALNIVPNALMMKAKKFKAVAIRTLSIQILCGSLAVWAALSGWGIYSLIISPVLSSIGVFSFNFCNYPQKFIIKLDTVVIKEIWGYSSYQFLFQIINYFSRNLDKLIIGKYFSMSQLGYYDKSYRLMMLPLQNITFVINPVLHPVLSNFQNDKKDLGNKNIRLLATLAQISFPLGAILYFCARDIILIIFGPDWMPSIPVFEILSFSIPLQILLSTSGSLFQAAGKTDHLFYTGCINTIVTVAGFMIAAILFKTIGAMAWAWVISLAICFINTYTFMNKKTFGISLRKFAKAFIPQIINTAIASLTAWVLINILHISNALLSVVYSSMAVLLPTFVMAYLLHQYNIISILQSICLRLYHR